MIINIFTIVSGSGAENKAGSGEVHCVAGTAPALLPVLGDTSLG